MYHNILYVLMSDRQRAVRYGTVGHRVLHAHASNRVGAGYHASIAVTVHVYVFDIIYSPMRLNVLLMIELLIAVL